MTLRARTRAKVSHTENVIIGDYDRSVIVNPALCGTNETHRGHIARTQLLPQNGIGREEPATLDETIASVCRTTASRQLIRTARFDRTSYDPSLFSIGRVRLCSTGNQLDRLGVRASRSRAYIACRCSASWNILVCLNCMGEQGCGGHSCILARLGASAMQVTMLIDEITVSSKLTHVIFLVLIISRGKSSPLTFRL